MGLFGKKVDMRRVMAGLQGAQATLHGDYGGAASIWGHYARDRQDEENDRAKAEAIQQAREAAFAWAKQQGMTDEAARTIAMDPTVAAAAVKDRTSLQKFDAGGGSVHDPVNGQTYVAPSERQIGRDIVRTDSEGKPNTVYSGVEPVVVPQGPEAGVYGWNNQGFVAPPSGTQKPQPAAGGRKLSTEEIEALEAQERGGASQTGSRTFPGSGGVFGGRAPRFPF